MFSFSYSTALLLAAACLLPSSAFSKTATSCEDRLGVHRLACEIGVISVESALFGRADTTTCGEGRPAGQLANTHCSLGGTYQRIKTRCDGKTVCEMNAGDIRTSDPCVGTYKYTQTNFSCVPALQHVACENSVVRLSCAEGQVIFVYGADYGRRDTTTCAYRRPPNQVQFVYCTSPTSVVAHRCNGKNSCDIRVVNSVFGDPCPGTYKYLEVSYHCEYPYVPLYEQD